MEQMENRCAGGEHGKEILAGIDVGSTTTKIVAWDLSLIHIFTEVVGGDEEGNDGRNGTADHVKRDQHRREHHVLGGERHAREHARVE